LKQKERGGRLHESLEALVKAKFRILFGTSQGSYRIEKKVWGQQEIEREEEDHKARTSKI
jgi:hypothetical protein